MRTQTPVKRQYVRRLRSGESKRAALVKMQRISLSSVMKMAFWASIAWSLILSVALAIIYVAFVNLGVMNSLSDLTSQFFGSPWRVTPDVILLGLVTIFASDVLIFLGLGLLWTISYNICATLSGGIEVLLIETKTSEVVSDG